jgi:hypothetical protein
MKMHDVVWVVKFLLVPASVCAVAFWLFSIASVQAQQQPFVSYETPSACVYVSSTSAGTGIHAISKMDLQSIGGFKGC